MTPVPALDFADLLKELPRGAWVAISRSQARVVAVGSDIRSVKQQAIDSGEREPVIMRVPESATAVML
jgi:hypothetical protein